MPSNPEPYVPAAILGAFAPWYILETELNAPATPSSESTGEPMNINGPCKSEIDPVAMINSPFLAVVFLRAANEPLLCLMICAIYVCLFSL